MTTILLSSFFDAEALIQTGGLLIILLAVYAQTGLFFCFFIPCGSFLFAGGIFSATGQLQHSLFTICTGAVLASVAGCITGYWFGHKAGPLLYKRKDSRFFKQKYLRAADAFYKKYGQFAISIGIAFPVIRTFAPVVAGIVGMRFSRFILFSTIGSTLLVPAFILPGYLIGSVPALKEYINLIIIGVICLIAIPVITRTMFAFRKAAKNIEEADRKKI